MVNAILRLDAEEAISNEISIFAKCVDISLVRVMDIAKLFEVAVHEDFSLRVVLFRVVELIKELKYVSCVFQSERVESAHIEVNLG